MKGNINRFLLAGLLAIGMLFQTGTSWGGDDTQIQSPVESRHIEAATPQNANPVFDGAETYKAAFEAIRDHHLLLADPAARAKWVAEWEHKFDKTGELKTEKGTDEALAKLNASLGQRFDYFMDVEATKAENEEVASTLVGIGTTLKMSGEEAIIKALPKGATRADLEKALVVGPKNQLVVDQPIEGGPAAQFLQSGDVIIGVDAKTGPDGKVINNVDGKLQKDVITSIRGAENTTVSITVERADGKGGVEQKTFSITRQAVSVPVVHTKDLGNGVSYIKLDNFMSKNAVKEMQAALKAAAKGKAIVLDLRNNPGGSLNQVLVMASFMLPEGKILTTLNRDGDKVTQNDVTLSPEFVMYFSPPLSPNNLPSVDQRPPLLVPADMPIVVLVNGGSASASEILSGALQHNHRAFVIGQPTLGKGVGQNVIDLPSGRRLHVTSFEFRPGGDKMDWIGIVPDQTVARDPKDPKVDAQLDAATAKATDLVKTRDALNTLRDGLKQKNEDEFKKRQTP